MDKILDRWEKIKKDTHRQNFYCQRKHFSPFFLSFDGMMIKEAQVVLTTLNRIMAVIIDEPISGWVNRQIAIVVERLYSQVLCRSLVPSPLQTRELY